MSESLYTAAPPNVQRAWDNTSLTLLKECPRKYYYAIRKGWTASQQSPALTFGILLHEATETYFKQRLAPNSAPHTIALRAAVLRLLTCTWAQEFYIKTADDAPELFATTSKAELDAWLAENPAYASVVHVRPRPWAPFDKVRSRETLLHSAIFYLDTLEHDVITPISMIDGRPAVELSFRVPLPLLSPDGDPYLYCGHIDRLGELNSSIFIVDLKHTASTISDEVIARYDMDAQFTGYLYGASIDLPTKPAGAVVDLVQVAKGFTRTARVLVSRSPSHLKEWLATALYWIQQAEHYARTDFYPLNETACHKYGKCQFLDICSASPEARDAMLQTHFVQRPWNPLESR